MSRVYYYLPFPPSPPKPVSLCAAFLLVFSGPTPSFLLPSSTLTNDALQRCASECRLACTPSLACFATEHRSACLCGSWGLGLYLFLSRPKTPTPSAFSLTQFSPLSPPARFHSVLVPRRPTPTPTSSFFMIPAQKGLSHLHS